MKNKRKILLAPLVLVCLVAPMCVVLLRESPCSYHTTEPSDEIITLTQQTQYPIGTDKIVVCVTNCGTYDGEINKPYLEVKRDGVWYIVKKPLQESETANLLYVLPGETKEFEIFLADYEPELAPGRYRAVFDFYGSEKYYAYQFDLVEA